ETFNFFGLHILYGLSRLCDSFCALGAVKVVDRIRVGHDLFDCISQLGSDWFRHLGACKERIPAVQDIVWRSALLNRWNIGEFRAAILSSYGQGAYLSFFKQWCGATKIDQSKVDLLSHQVV